MEITDVNTLFGAYPSQHPDRTPEALITVMQAQDVAWGLALSTRGLFYSDAEGNAETMQACRAHDRLIPVATLNPTGYWGQPGIIESTGQEAFEMFRFFPHVQGWPLDYAPFSQALTKLAALPRMPIMVSIQKPGDSTLLARVIADYPHPIILEGVSAETLTEAIAVMRANDRLYLETHALHVPDALSLLRDTVGITRVLFGSDAPGMSLGASLRYVKRSSLSTEEQIAVLSSNARHIWHAEGEE